MTALDGQPAALGLGGDPARRASGDVARRHAPALLGQPERVATLAGADVEGAARGEFGDLVDEGAVRVAAPDLLAAVAMIPVGLVGGWSGRGSDVVVGETEADHRPDPAAGGGGGQHLLTRIGHVASGVEPWHVRGTGRVGLDEISQPARVSSRS